MSNLTQTATIVKLDTDQYAQIDLSRNIVTIHYGQREGKDSDWGGSCIAAYELDKALAIANAVAMLRQSNESALFLAAEDEAIERWAARLDEQRANAHDLVSSSWGHD